MRKQFMFLFAVPLALSVVFGGCGGGGPGNGGGNGVTPQDAEKIAANAFARLMEQGINFGNAAAILNAGSVPNPPPISFIVSLPKPFASLEKPLAKAIQAFKALTTLQAGPYTCTKDPAASSGNTSVLNCICEGGGTAVITTIETLKTFTQCGNPEDGIKIAKGTFTMVLNDCVVPSCNVAVGMNGQSTGSFDFEQNECTGTEKIIGRIDAAASCADGGIISDVAGQKVCLGAEMDLNGEYDNNSGQPPKIDPTGKMTTSISATPQQNTDIQFVGLEDLFDKTACPSCNNLIDLDGKMITEIFSCTFLAQVGVDPMGNPIFENQCGDCNELDDLLFTKIEDLPNGAVRYMVADVPPVQGEELTGELCGDDFTWILETPIYRESGIWNFSLDANGVIQATGGASYSNSNGGGGACTHELRLTSEGPPPNPQPIKLKGFPICPGCGGQYCQDIPGTSCDCSAINPGDGSRGAPCRNNADCDGPQLACISLCLCDEVNP